MSFQLTSRVFRICLSVPTPLFLLLLVAIGAGLFYLFSKLK